MNEHGYIMLLIGGFLGWVGRYWADRLQRQGLFDHRLRIEKEYQIYAELWEKLFAFRIAAHGLVDPLQEGVQEDPLQKYFNAFNAFQAVVCRNEPFIFAQVFEPANAIVTQGRVIDSARKRIKSLEEYRDRTRDPAADERVAEKQLAEDDNQQKAIQEIDRVFPQVCDAVRSRITLNSASGGWWKGWGKNLFG